MRLLFDVSILGYSELRTQYRTGIFQVALALLKAISQHPGVTLGVYSSSGNIGLCRRALRKSGLQHLPFIGSRAWGEVTFLGLVARNLLYRKGLRRPALLLSRGLAMLESWRGATDRDALTNWDSYLSPMDAVPEGIRAIPTVTAGLVLHDLIPLRLPDYGQSASDPTRWFSKMLRSITMGDLVFAVSDFTRRDFLADRPEFPVDRVVVAPNAVDQNRFRPGLGGADLSAWGVSGNPPFFLAVSTLEPRKRIDTVIRAYQLYRAAGGQALLVVCGPDRKRHREQILLPLLPADRNSVVFTGYVEDGQLPRLYSSCLAFVSLSEYEGFGLPILEAMSCGSVVVVSDRSSHPEVAGTAGLYVSPDDAEGVSQFLLRLASDAAFREDQQQKSLEQSEKFSWNTTAATICNAFEAAKPAVQP